MVDNSDYTKFIAYCNNTLTEYESPNVSSIRNHAFFKNQYIESLSFPKVTSTGYFSFAYMENLSEINLPLATQFYDYLFYNDTNLSSVIAPNVTTVRYNCFYGCTSLSTANFLSNVSSIYNEAFYNCSSLTNVSLDSIVSLYPKAFANCTSLIKVWISSTCIHIFSNNDSGVEDMTYSPFYGCNPNCIIYTDAERPASNWSKYWNVVDSSGNKLNVSWGASYDDYLNNTYNSRTLLENFISGSIGDIENTTLTSLTSSHFLGCSFLFNMSLPQVTQLPSHCFERCGFVSIKDDNFPNATIVRDGAFTSCSSLKDIDLSHAVHVDSYAFQSCSYLRKVWIPSTCLTLGTQLFVYATNCEVYTDASGDLSGWSQNWNSTSWENNRFAHVNYNSTHDQYLQA